MMKAIALLISGFMVFLLLYEGMTGDQPLGIMFAIVFALNVSAFLFWLKLKVK